MKPLAVALATALALAGAGYLYRLELLVALAPIVADWRDPIGPHRAVAWAQGPARATVGPRDRPPNIVLILADDMGMGDVSCYSGAAVAGAPTTPNIDSIARRGAAFANGYAANAVCAPSRAAIMTGRYATRFGFEYTPFYRVGVTIFDWMQQRDPSPLPTLIHHDRAAALPEMAALGMPASEITMAEVLKTAGYQTAHIGKWHLGGASGMRAEHQGFDDSLNMVSGLYLPEDAADAVNAKLAFSGIDKMVWASMRYAASFNGGETFAPQGYLTDYYTDQAVRVIEANRHRPFFLYLSHWAIHNPLQATRADYDAVAHVEDHAARVYAAMIRALDRSVGRVLAALREHDLEENTLVIFTSDNGGAGYLGLADVNRPYRGWKLTLFEGGIHVPLLMQWPARIAPGRTIDHPVAHMDLFATAAAAAGAPVPADRAIDGADLLPYLGADADAALPPPHETLFWRQGHHQAVRHGDWKLIVSRQAPADSQTAAEERHWLFDLAEDPTERRDISAQQPAQVAALLALLDGHNAAQREPLWPSVIESPQLADKTEAAPYAPGDEYVYWPN